MSEKHAYTCPSSQELVRDRSVFKMVAVGGADFLFIFLECFLAGLGTKLTQCTNRRKAYAFIQYGFF